MTHPIAFPALTSSVEQNTSQLVDQFGRYKQKLRISLTDRCNFHCAYCMPDHPQWLAKKDLLSFEELFRFCQVMVQLGIEHIRLTGGEPLMRQGVVHFIRDLQQLKTQGLKRISMTSNAFYLKKHAVALKQAGLDDINISLDSIQANTFFAMTQKNIEPVLEGIAAAQQAGLKIKLNCVVLADKNASEIVELTQWAYQQQLPLRFIEYMPLDQPEHWQRHKVISEDEIIQQLKPYFQIQKQQRQHDPATIYRLNDHYELGVISTISKPFCQSCNRLRLTATGELFTCLFANTGTALRDLLQPNREQFLLATIRQAVWHKKAGFIAQQQAPLRKISMHAIGG
ncbi:GTP 3',8-cyclase MoaA [Acinetobacter populi]|uniref:GTP 3',8-cyclase n=1 Tax=Acinetobacter populi TaxID=1582270 RepID=A0A1Z9YXW4_9GAMM|nr:GTP 3',8-cyclase MoaA [Acinetobacter populi]OUY07057.1 GTP 3',8-cyclase MoaA [Acinetobacter populi]